MGWGNSFDDVTGKAIAERQKQDIDPMNELIQEVGKKLIDMIPKVWDTETLVKAYADVINRNNLKPTHDPYANPNSHIYYECGCGEILDPQTKSFAALNNYASEKGWKIRFGADGYTPYCVKCGEDVE